MDVDLFDNQDLEALAEAAAEGASRRADVERWCAVRWIRLTRPYGSVQSTQKESRSTGRHERRCTVTRCVAPEEPVSAGAWGDEANSG